MFIVVGGETEPLYTSQKYSVTQYYGTQSRLRHPSTTVSMCTKKTAICIKHDTHKTGDNAVPTLIAWCAALCGPHPIIGHDRIDKSINSVSLVDETRKLIRVSRLLSYRHMLIPENWCICGIIAKRKFFHKNIRRKNSLIWLNIFNWQYFFSSNIHIFLIKRTSIILTWYF